MRGDKREGFCTQKRREGSREGGREAGRQGGREETEQGTQSSEFPPWLHDSKLICEGLRGE